MSMPRLVIVTALLAWAAPATAADRVPPVTNPVVLQECGACHMAFPPAFLPARSWSRLVYGMSDHFGEDANLPAETIEIIGAYLTANAGDVAPSAAARKYVRWFAPSGTPLRLTENPAFLHKHRFPRRVWEDPKVVTRSNCLACHADAASGRFE